MADLRAFPWAAELGPEQLSRFINDLWGAAAAENDLDALAAVEKVIAEHRPDAVQSPPCPLDERELAVLTGLAYGATYAALGERLGVTESTTERVLFGICRQLDVASETDALEVAACHGWIPELRTPASAGRRFGRGRHAWRRDFRERVAQMREKPGQTVPFGPYGSYGGAYGAARRINKGLLPEVQPAGSFSAQVVVNGSDQWVVEARYLGEPSSAKEPS